MPYPIVSGQRGSVLGDTGATGSVYRGTAQQTTLNIAAAAAASAAAEQSILGWVLRD